MLLLNTTSLQLCNFHSDAPPPYATFSANLEDENVVHKDFCSPQTARQNPGFKVLQRACSESHSRGLSWLWNDAVCIDRSSALSQSLNSLAEIYRKGRLCIVFLHDLLEIAGYDFDVERVFSNCSWFKHVWMLPHLIFSTVLHFYDAQWRHIGEKSELIPEISRCTSIEEGILRTSDSLKDVSNCKKMSWAAGLSADPIEDTAYSLIGIFNVNLSINYGEGTGSFMRLQEEVLRKSTDYSLLAWRPQTNQPYRGLLAHSPLEYSHFRNKSKAFPNLKGDLTINSNGIHVQAGIGARGSELLLPLYTSGGATMWIVLALWDGLFVRNCTETILVDDKVSNVCIRSITVSRDVSPILSSTIATHNKGPYVNSCEMKGTNGLAPAPRITPSISGYIGLDMHAEYSESAHITRDDQSGKCSLGAYGEGFSDWLSSTRSHTGETTDGESALVSPSSENATHPLNSPFTLDPGHPFATVIGELKAILVDRFLNTCKSRPPKRQLLSLPRAARKRPRLAWSDPYMAVEFVSDSEDMDTVVVHHAGERTSTFICPYYVKDKKKYEECLTRHSLSTIDEIKEHMWESHRRPNFCPICKTTFATMSDRDHHIRERNCEHHDSPTFDGLTDAQIQQLAQQASVLSSRESQWYELWDIVFPSGPRSVSPYYSSEQELRVVALRRFWEANGQEIISDFLRERDLQGWGVADEERSLAILFQVVLHDAIDEVYRRFAGEAHEKRRTTAV